ncbi:hypothetical protein BVRB_007900 [Beta vulgaris subsp. vulgaris]|uniref:Uncharacterized protein n=1 Tax=Beta vulgaris subsp. vulgaris TaxID=3555 RepID=A0A0J8B6E3_BETVV|nr:hypothetical protein BVRB_007900 [Beta vulgaris subsp. vulgaris]
MDSSLKVAAEAAGKPDWDHSGPTNAGEYSNWPKDTEFWVWLERLQTMHLLGYPN